MAVTPCILIVDDEENQRKNLSFILKKKGYLVESAGTGKEALEKAGSRTISLTLLDINLPDTNGLELVAPLKATNPEMTIIIITGFASVENSVHSLNAGVSGYLIKPFNHDELLAKIRDSLERQDLIREKQEAERALLESEIKYRTLAETAFDQIFIIGRDDTLQYANTASLKMLHLSYNQAIGTSRKTLFPPDIADAQGIQLKSVFETGERVRKEEKIQFGAQEFWIDTNLVPLRDETGMVTAVLGVSRDITERKQAFETLRIERQRLYDVLETLPVYICLLTPDYHMPFANKYFRETFGESKGQRCYEFLFNRTEPCETCETYTVIKTRAPHHWYWTGPNGRDYDIYDFPFTEMDGSLNILEMGLDITERKKAEETLRDFNKKLQQGIEEKTAALRESELRHSMLFESSRDAIMTLEPPDWRFTSGNPASLAMFRAKDEAEFTAAAPWDLSPTFQPDGRPSGEKAKEMIDNAVREGSYFFEWTHKRLDGEEFPATVLLTRFEYKEKQILQATVRDITERKCTEDKIKASLDEKVLLLREIHHRVKNNLQIIISLVNLQMRKVDDERLKKIMAETQNRVRAMALVHEKLCESESLSTIDLADYIRFLVTHLFSYYNTDPRKVALDIVIGKIMVGIDTAIPLGLIVNELASNALKHAFPDGRTGSLSITVREEDTTLHLTIKYDGIGFPADLDWRHAESLGFQLVISLVEQLDGTIELDRSAGTTFTIAVQEKE